MTTLAIDLQKNANQNLQVTLGGNVYRLTLNTRLDELYMSIIKNGEPVIYNRICQNLNLIEEGFVFVDLDGNENPRFEQFNDRFVLTWTDGLI